MLFPCDSHEKCQNLVRLKGFEFQTPQVQSLGARPSMKGQLDDHCSNELRQRHHVTSQKLAYLRITRQMN